MKTIIYTLALIIFSSFAYSQKSDDYKTYKKLNTALKIIEQTYVDDANEQELVVKAIKAMLKELDPHSVYYSKKAIKKADEPLKGNFDGVGIQFNIFHDTILVIAPIVGGPSDKVGIIAGDKIVYIDGEQSFGEKVNNKFVFDKLRGKKGTKVEVSIKRAGRDELLDFTIIRDKIPINSLLASFMLDNKTGYIKLNRFAKKTVVEFFDAIKILQNQGIENLVLDLRSNTGGYLGTAVNLTDQFLDEKKLIVYTQGRKYPRKEYKCRIKGMFEKGKIVVLINEGSASASEIVTGAIQDWDRGIVIGRRSYGKGLVQRPFQLPDSSTIRLTTSRYYTPSGRCIQKSYDEGIDRYRKDLKNRRKDGELYTEKQIEFPDSLKYYTHNKRLVYGGGGISPDIFVAFDSARYNDVYTDYVRKGIVNEYVLNHLDKKRKEYKEQYTSFEDFNKNFFITDEHLQQMLSKAKKQKIKIDDVHYQKAEELIRYYAKALFARNLYKAGDFYQVLSDIDNEIQKAIEVINDEKRYKKLLKN